MTANVVKNVTSIPLHRQCLFGAYIQACVFVCRLQIFMTAVEISAYLKPISECQ